MVRQSLIIGTVVVLIIVIIGGYTIWQSGYFNLPTATPSPSETPRGSPVLLLEPSTQERIRDSAMNSIKIYHNETAQFMQNLTWTGGKVDTGLVGAEKYVYTTLKPVPGTAGWTVTLDYPVVPNPMYTVTANYTQSGVQSPYGIVWGGTWQNGNITQASYSSNVPYLMCWALGD